jgi:hypothetical protein
VVSPLVRQAMGRNDSKGALSWLKEARSVASGGVATTLEVWRAEVFVKAGRPDSATVVYERLITPDEAGAALALDAGEMMLANGYLDHAKALLIKAGELARDHGRDWIERRARLLMDGLS